MKKPGTVERVAGCVVLALLAAIAGGVYAKQRHFNPAVSSAVAIQGDASQPGATAKSPAAELAAPDGFTTMSAMEVFDEENLAEKIDGKAELYTMAGFKLMRCRRFADAAQPGRWFEWFVYDMKDRDAAFSVFSIQRRTNGVNIAGVDNAYSTENAAFVCQGTQYLEWVAADVALQPALVKIAQAWSAKNGGTKEARPDKELLPAEGQNAGTFALMADDAFGCAGMDQVYIARYGAANVTLFAKRCASPAAAQALAETFRKFLATIGDPPSPLPGVADAWHSTSYDTHEVVFVRGAVIAGVHEAPDLATATALAGKLAAHIEKDAK